MEDTELGLEEFGDFSKSKNNEEEDNTDYSGVLGKFRRIRKIIYKWARLIYRYFDTIIDFEKKLVESSRFFSGSNVDGGFSNGCGIFIFCTSRRNQT